MNNQRKVVILEKLASMSKEAKIPGWARGFATQEGGVLKVLNWPKDAGLKARLKMLQHGRRNAALHRKGGGHPRFSGKPGSGKPKGGWPEGSAMDQWRRSSGRSSS